MLFMVEYIVKQKNYSCDFVNFILDGKVEVYADTKEEAIDLAKDTLISQVWEYGCDVIDATRDGEDIVVYLENGDIEEYYDFEVMDYEGLCWCELPDIVQDDLMKSASAVDARTGNVPRQSNDCIIDFGNTGFSVSGKIEYIDGEAVLTPDNLGELYRPIAF